MRHFRSRCTEEKGKVFTFKKTTYSKGKKKKDVQNLYMVRSQNV